MAQLYYDKGLYFVQGWTARKRWLRNNWNVGPSAIDTLQSVKVHFE
jgi:hypothetical protein